MLKYQLRKFRGFLFLDNGASSRATVVPLQPLGNRRAAHNDMLSTRWHSRRSRAVAALRRSTADTSRRHTTSTPPGTHRTGDCDTLPLLCRCRRRQLQIQSRECKEPTCTPSADTNDQLTSKGCFGSMSLPRRQTVLPPAKHPLPSKRLRLSNLLSLSASLIHGGICASHSGPGVVLHERECLSPRSLRALQQRI